MTVKLTLDFQSFCPTFCSTKVDLGWRMSVVLRNRMYHLRRRVPARFAAVESRAEVWASLKTDSKELAAKKVPIVWDALVAGWEAQLAGHSSDAVERFEAARGIADSHGVNYLPISKVQDLPVAELVARVKLLENRDDAGTAQAVLGLVESPGLNVSQAFETYLELTPDRVRGKSDNQKRCWINPRKKAIRNFIKVVGDIPMSEISRDGMLDFRSWWMQRIAEENLAPNSANKEIGHVSNILKTVNELKGLGLDLPLFNLRLKEGDTKKERFPFSDDWIKNKLMAPDALLGLNDEARAILLGMINTGYRPSEAIGLTGDRIRLDDEVPHISIAPTADRQIKNRTSRREIPLVGVSLEIFRDFPGGFPRYRSKPATLSATVNKFLRENGLMESDHHVMYSLRHSFEDRMLRAGIDERVRRELMGHSIGREKYGQAGGLNFKADQLRRMAL